MPNGAMQIDLHVVRDHDVGRDNCAGADDNAITNPHAWPNRAPTVHKSRGLQPKLNQLLD